jgi:uracil-DNA glycosylase family 4
MDKWTPEWKAEKLAFLADLWSDCGSCDLCQTRTNVVFGTGNPNADILFVGEGPGADEDISGIPFCGESGSLFDALLSLANISRGDTYITNIVACRPPNNRDPMKVERDACRPRLNEIIYIVDPLVIVPIGAEALKALARGRDWSILDHHGTVFSSPRPEFRILGDPNGVEIPGRLFPRKGDDKKEHTLDYDMIPIVHPAFVLRTDGYDPKKPVFPQNGWAVKTVRDLEKIATYVETIKARYANPARPI